IEKEPPSDSRITVRFLPLVLCFGFVCCETAGKVRAATRITKTRRFIRTNAASIAEHGQRFTEVARKAAVNRLDSVPFCSDYGLSEKQVITPTTGVNDCNGDVSPTHA